ncbi:MULTISPECIES: hypothetical protein [unclassified Mesorhizobium]|uniref:hypothetical protein n=1 Tax=unclassified Mesorhizobium TaxID=325217 RepID=UPI003337CB30
MTKFYFSVLFQNWPGTETTAAWRGMFSEGFAYYTAERPSLYFALGIAKHGLGQAGVHTVDFTIHPDSFVEGVRLMSLAAPIATSGEATWNYCRWHLQKAMKNQKPTTSS